MNSRFRCEDLNKRKIRRRILVRNVGNVALLWGWVEIGFAARSYQRSLDRSITARDGGRWTLST